VIVLTWDAHFLNAGLLCSLCIFCWLFCATDRLVRLVSVKTFDMLIGTLNSNHSLSLTVKRMVHLQVSWIRLRDMLSFMHYRERQNQAKINRRLDKKSKEYLMLIEDERRNAEQYKDQVSN